MDCVPFLPGAKHQLQFEVGMKLHQLHFEVGMKLPNLTQVQHLSPNILHKSLACLPTACRTCAFRETDRELVVLVGRSLDLNSATIDVWRTSNLISDKRTWIWLPKAINSAQHRLDQAEAAMLDDECDTELCPVECVREFKSRTEFDALLHYAKQEHSLVVVDFYRTACGSCKYIEKGFSKLCKGASSSDVSVLFLKHNVMDEYEEQSEIAESLKIRAVPLFHFYKNGELVEAFPTREKDKILDAINRHTGQILTLDDVNLTHS